MKANVEVIPHHLQRYETCGDWQIGKRSGNLNITVSEMGNDDYEFLVGLHELVECYLCKKRGITDEAVTSFDTLFEQRRIEGNTDEPGDDPTAPYRQEHRTATLVEMIVADALEVDWKDYEETVNALHG